MTKDTHTRFRTLLTRETELLQNGCEYVAGVDEAGRGPLAGPVVAAAACRNERLETGEEEQDWLRDIYDSKKVTEKKREELFERLTGDDSPFLIGTGIIDSEEIDKINILRATHKAMRMAVGTLIVVPDFVLVDGTEIPALEIKQEKVIKGDMKCLCIAAASIVAKVTRDRIMRKYARDYPEYEFEKHKGYGTARHITSIRNHGRCAIHRKSFKVTGLD
jgi:ribonuclease HII